MVQYEEAFWFMVDGDIYLSWMIVWWDTSLNHLYLGLHQSLFTQRKVFSCIWFNDQSAPIHILGQPWSSQKFTIVIGHRLHEISFIFHVNVFGNFHCHFRYQTVSFAVARHWQWSRFTLWQLPTNIRHQFRVVPWNIELFITCHI